jgi:hypothetical protein
LANYLNKIIDNGKLVYTTSYEDEDGKPTTRVLLKVGNTVQGKVKDVTTAGTAVRLDDLPSTEVTVIAKKSNTGSIYVGGSDVSSTVYGVELLANESFTFNISNANAIYINSSVNGEGVSYVTI